MDKENNSQLELFSQINDGSETPSARPRAFSWQIRNHEKKLLLSIIFIIIAVVSFSLGVEKGKRITRQKIAPGSNQLMAQKPQKAVTAPATPRAAAPDNQQPAANTLLANKSGSPLQIKEVKTVTPQAPGRYTIQVASFKNRASAENESRSLKKKGYSTIVIAKGNYAVLCVGGFKDKESAKKVLSELKKRYQDCFIWRM